MIPVSVRLCGFMSYREPQELRFDEDGLWVLEGPNGVGKSTIFDAITFALFGQHRLGKQHHDDLINHDSNSLEVELVLQIENETYKLHRCVPRKGRSIWQISRRAPDGRFLPVSGTDQKEPYNAWVRERIGLDYDAFTSSVLLLQGESEKLIRQDPEGRRKLLAQLIDLSRYERLHEHAKRVEDEHRRAALQLSQKIQGLRELKPEDINAAEAALAEAEKERRSLDTAVEALSALLPAADQRERLLAEQVALTLRQAAEQDVLARAAEIRERMSELEELSSILDPLREVAAAQRALDAAKTAAATKEARVEALRAEEDAARVAEEAARQREETLQQLDEDLRRREAELRDERERLLPVQANWKAAEVLRQQQEETAKQLAALPEVREGAPTAADLEAAQQAFKTRQAEESNARAERKACNDRLQRLERLTGEMAGEPVTCSLCGQEVTATHAQMERERLLADQKRLDRELEAAEQGRHEAERALSRAQRAHEDAKVNAQRRRTFEQAQEQGAKRLAQVLAGVTPEAAQAAGERLAELGPLLKAQRDKLAAQQGELRDARNETKKAAGRRQRAGENRGELERELKELRETRQQTIGKLSAYQGKLPESMREARPEMVAATEERVKTLQPYRDQAARLRGAESGEAGRRLTEIARQPDEVPSAARRAVEDLRRELNEKREARDAVQKRRDDGAAELAKLKGERKQRADVEEKLKAAQLEQRLHGKLADLLGPEELQRRLVRDAEQAIVQLANQELAGLTQGRIRLALRPGKDGEGAAQKALDLLVYNLETGEQATALALASGSQKFRIAISLALAIGHYLARETRRVESVIIDEGFGCLDRANREDAVEVLQELSGHLSRVILVSHQEEFSGRFNSGYRIDLVNRASVPTRVSR